MKIIISEDKINDLVVKHLNTMFDVNNIGWTPGIDDWGNEVDYAIEFYGDDYDEGDNTLFRWYSEDYWDSEENEGWGESHNKELKRKSPLVMFEDDDKKHQLDNIFGERWKQPFIDWFQDNFHVPVRTIE